ncbi:MAG: RelA/SpoT family protein [Aggregatilineales bacterium]
MTTIDAIPVTTLTGLERFDPKDRALIERAYRFSYEAHKEQKRQSGEPYITHPVAVAQILVDLRVMDAEPVAAALLHDVVEDVKTVTQDDIEREFGLSVAQLVDGVTKIEQLPTDTSAMKGGKAGNREAETLRKTFLAMYIDFRVIMIKLADRLHNMRTLGYLKPERQQRMAKETLTIFAPLANRLGMWQLKWELEDLSFRYLHPDKYREIAELIDERRTDREAYLKHVIDSLRDELEKAGIYDAQISGRPKHIYSIYRKIERKGVSFDQVYDARAVRVIVPTNDLSTCYQALGVVHSLWRPIPGQFDDYIAAPKDNFYRSLHTAVKDDDGKTLEVQIRTPEMHEHAEFGVAAHWRYKEGVARDEEFERRIEYVRRLMERIDDSEVAPNAEAYVKAAQTDILEDSMIYVFTPKGDIIDLTNGATPIDFAYAVHTEIGNRCRGARVNGQMVNLNYRLHSGDQVEVITANRGGPSLDWLDDDEQTPYVKTSRARGKIRSWFRKQGREQNILLGRDVVDRELKRLSRPNMTHESLARLFGMQTDDFLAMIGYGDITSVQISTRVLESEKREKREREKQENTAPEIGLPEPAPINASGGIDITGSDGKMLIRLARCCHPVQGDQIIGFITRGKGVTVHRADCPDIINTTERERLINVSWGQAASKTYPIPIEVEAFDRPGLLHDITGIAANERINLYNVQIKITGNTARCRMTLQLESLDQLPRILARIERLPNVIRAHRHITGAARREHGEEPVMPTVRKPNNGSAAKNGHTHKGKTGTGKSIKAVPRRTKRD